MRIDAMQDEILMRAKSMPKKLLPKADWQLEVRDGFLYAGIYEHLGAVWFEKIALSDLPNDLISFDDLKLFCADEVNRGVIACEPVAGHA